MKKLFIALALAGSIGLAWALPWAFAAVPSTNVGNANYQILNTDVRLIPIVALTTNRTWTLPYAGSVGNNSIVIQDAQGNVGGANSCIVIAASSGDTINGTSGTYTFCSTYGRLTLTPLSGTNWVVSDNGSLFISSSVNLANAKQITTNSSATLTSVSLPPGDWDCRAVMSESISPTTTVQQLSASIGLVDGVIGTQGATAVDVKSTTEVSAILLGARGTDIAAGPTRQSLAGTTTIFLVGGATFATSQLWAYGSLECRGQD